MFQTQTADRPVAPPKPEYYRNAHNARHTAALRNHRAHRTAATHDLPIALDPEHSAVPVQRNPFRSVEGSYEEHRRAGAQQFQQQTRQQPQRQQGNVAAQQFHQQFYGQQQDQFPHQPYQQSQLPSNIHNPTKTDYLLELESAQLEIAKLRSLDEAKEQEMKKQLTVSGAGHHELAKQKAEIEWRTDSDRRQAEAIREKRKHEIALADHHARMTLTDRIVMFVLPKAGIFILLLCVLGIIFANPLLGFALIAVCAIVGSAVWMNKDRVDAMERLQISRDAMVAEAYRSKRIDLPTVERVLLTPEKREAAGLRQIEAPSSSARRIR